MRRLALASSVSPLLFAAFFVLGCNGNADSPTDGGTAGLGDATVTSTPLPCDVQAVLQSHCQSCHQSPPLNGAPMPLMTLEDLHAVTLNDPDGVPPTSANEPVYQMVGTRIASTSNPMPPPPASALDAADLATLQNWISAGAPATDGATCGDVDGGGLPDAAPPTLSCTSDDLTLKSASAWTMPSTEDDQYVCYSFTAPAGSIPAGTTRHVLGIVPNVDNKKIVHHVLLFEATPSDPSIGTTPAPCNAGGSALWRLVYGWAPGGGAMQTPPDVGFPYDETTQWVVQVHYNNIGHLSGQTDSSGFSMCTTDQPVKYDADVMAFGTFDINVPAHGSQDITCSLPIPSVFAGVHLFSSFPHMHALGTAIQTEQVYGAGPGIVGLGQSTPWNFNTQIWFPIDSTLNQGDTVNTRCAWTNPTDQPVQFGYDTEDEMCFSFTSYYPKIESSFWSWALPAKTATCAPTAGTALPVPDAG